MQKYYWEKGNVDVLYWSRFVQYCFGFGAGLGIGFGDGYFLGEIFELVFGVREFDCFNFRVIRKVNSRLLRFLLCGFLGRVFIRVEYII